MAVNNRYGKLAEGKPIPNQNERNIIPQKILCRTILFLRGTPSKG
jgi:hypothetical protein